MMIKNRLLVGFIIVLKFSTDNASIIACIHLLPLVPGTSHTPYKCLLTEWINKSKVLHEYLIKGYLMGGWLDRQRRE